MSKKTIKINEDRARTRVLLEIGQWKAELLQGKGLGEPATEMCLRDLIELSGASVAWVYRQMGITPKPAFAQQ